MDGTYSEGVWNEKRIPSGEMTNWYTNRRWKDIIQVAAVVIKSWHSVLSVVSGVIPLLPWCVHDVPGENFTFIVYKVFVFAFVCILIILGCYFKICQQILRGLKW